MSAPVPRIQEDAHYTQIAKAAWKARTPKPMSRLLKRVLFLVPSTVVGLGGAFALLLVNPDLLPGTIVGVPRRQVQATPATALQMSAPPAAPVTVGSYAEAVARSS